ncbi:hypothetical protein [Sedimentitalea nanhaiensis]|uniref:PH domain-containing protein n=1 Tax=Sedimentitalea nanhaiensis TaxID=999627 RepID=A0A1I6YGP1_9RHOB|nr:hypothetical protein [Sedimentitalea nanhaiensis]SFT49572.1 hypothetical protein SAMN05216236_102199 [Sedimentitalea nanhaiensis]
MDHDVRAVIEASAVRRWIGVGMLAAIAFLMVYGAFSSPPNPLWQTVLIGLAAVVLWIALRLWQATAFRIELTDDGLRDSSGAEIARLSDIKSVQRGSFAFKPTNGFLLRTRTTGARAWRPGLWWRFGSRIGIGGVTPAHQAKYMAEALATRLAERDQASSHLI